MGIGLMTNMVIGLGPYTASETPWRRGFGVPVPLLCLICIIISNKTGIFG